MPESDDNKKDEDRPKNHDLRTLFIFVIFLAAIVGAVWYLGWRANQYDIIKQLPPTYIYTNVNSK